MPRAEPPSVSCVCVILICAKADLVIAFGLLRQMAARLFSLAPRYLRSRPVFALYSSAVVSTGSPSRTASLAQAFLPLFL